MTAGKGDRLRPIQDRERFNRNWDRIFGGGDGTSVPSCQDTATDNEIRNGNVTPDPDINPSTWEEKDE